MRRSRLQRSGPANVVAVRSAITIAQLTVSRSRPTAHCVRTLLDVAERTLQSKDKSQLPDRVDEAYEMLRSLAPSRGKVVDAQVKLWVRIGALQNAVRRPRDLHKLMDSSSS